MMWEVRFEGLPDDARAKPLLAWGIFLACLPLRLIYAALSSDNCCDCIPSNTSILWNQIYHWIYPGLPVLIASI